MTSSPSQHARPHDLYEVMLAAPEYGQDPSTAPTTPEAGEAQLQAQASARADAYFGAGAWSWQDWTVHVNLTDADGKALAWFCQATARGTRPDPRPSWWWEYTIRPAPEDVPDESPWGEEPGPSMDVAPPPEPIPEPVPQPETPDAEGTGGAETPATDGATEDAPTPAAEPQG